MNILFTIALLSTRKQMRRGICLKYYISFYISEKSDNTGKRVLNETGRNIELEKMELISFYMFTTLCLMLINDKYYVF